MKRPRFHLLFASISVMIISACSSLVTSTPHPSPQPIQVTYTSTLQPWVEILHQCAIEHPEIALITEVTSAVALEFSTGDLTLWYGEPPQEFNGYAASLGEDEIIVITGNDVAQRNLSAEQLTALYSQPSSIYQVWTYNKGNELRSVFDSAVLREAVQTSYLRLAPSPAAMLEAVTSDPMAIGYLPESWLTSDVRVVSLEPDLQRSLNQPILALAGAEPKGNLKNYLICLQQSDIP